MGVGSVTKSDATSVTLSLNPEGPGKNFTRVLFTIFCGMLYYRIFLSQKFGDGSDQLFRI